MINNRTVRTIETNIQVCIQFTSFVRCETVRFYIYIEIYIIMFSFNSNLKGILYENYIIITIHILPIRCGNHDNAATFANSYIRYSASNNQYLSVGLRAMLSHFPAKSNLCIYLNWKRENETIFLCGAFRILYITEWRYQTKTIYTLTFFAYTKYTTGIK